MKLGVLLFRLLCITITIYWLEIHEEMYKSRAKASRFNGFGTAGKFSTVYIDGRRHLHTNINLTNIYIYKNSNNNLLIISIIIVTVKCL